MAIRAVIQGVGHGVPEKILTNAELSLMVDTSDEWIRQRTGIVERRISAEHESASTFASVAARQAMERAGVDPTEIDLIICATVTGDMLFPSTACLVQAAIGASRAGAFDLGAACAGFIYAVASAAAMIESGAIRTALVIGVDVLSKTIDWTDRSTCVLFGDGAGAVILRAEEGSDRGVIDTVLLADGTGAPHIDIEIGGTRYPYGSPSAEGKRRYVYMAGAEVYRFAVNAMGDACIKVLEQAGITSDAVDLFVPHQANLRIIDSAAKRLGLSDDKVFVNVHKYGNTSGGSIPIALYEAEQEGRLKKGMLALTVGFGAGVVWGANLIRW